MADIYLLEDWARYPVPGRFDNAVDQISKVPWVILAGGSGNQLSTTDQRNGLACYVKSSTSSTCRISKGLAGGSKTFAVVGFATKIIAYGSSPDRTTGCGFAHGASFLYAYHDPVIGDIVVVNGSAILARSSEIIAPGSYIHIGLSYNTTSGDWQLWINKTVGDAPNLTGNSTASGAITAVVIYTGGLTTTQVAIDDVYCADQFCGDCVVDSYVPNADGTPQDFIPSSGTAFSILDNRPVTADYVEGATIGDISNFTLPSPSPVIYQVFGVMVEARAVRTGASVEELEILLSDGVNTINSSPVVVPQTTPSLIEFFPPNAPDGNPWSPLNINGLIPGFEKVT